MANALHKRLLQAHRDIALLNLQLAEMRRKLYCQGDPPVWLCDECRKLWVTMKESEQ